MNDVHHTAGKTEHATAETTDAVPGVPGFRSWRGIYLFVFACFVLTVVLLAIFTHVFS